MAEPATVDVDSRELVDRRGRECCGPGCAVRGDFDGLYCSGECEAEAKAGIAIPEAPVDGVPDLGPDAGPEEGPPAGPTDGQAAWWARVDVVPGPFRVGRYTWTPKTMVVCECGTRFWPNHPRTLACPICRGCEHDAMPRVAAPAPAPATPAARRAHVPRAPVRVHEDRRTGETKVSRRPTEEAFGCVRCGGNIGARDQVEAAGGGVQHADPAVCEEQALAPEPADDAVVTRMAEHLDALTSQVRELGERLERSEQHNARVARELGLLRAAVVDPQVDKLDVTLGAVMRALALIGTGARKPEELLPMLGVEPWPDGGVAR